jgi:hypothetical protein
MITSRATPRTTAGKTIGSEIICSTIAFPAKR